MLNVFGTVLLLLIFGIGLLAMVISGGSNQCSSCVNKKYHEECDNEKDGPTDNWEN